MKEIQLTQGKVALVDDDMFDRVNYFKWSAVKVKRRSGRIVYYAIAHITIFGKHTKIKMHRLIMGMPRSGDTDHEDGNGLNNQRLNLRLCTRSQNNMNRARTPNSSSMYKGVSLEKSGKTWRARIHIDNKEYHLGTYPTEELAARRYNEVALAKFGAFATLNIIL